MVLDDDSLSADLLAEKVMELYFTRQTYLDAMGKSNLLASIKSIMKLIDDAAAHK